MPYSKSQRFDLGIFMKTRKEMRQKAMEESRAMKTELSTINRQINRLKSKVCALNVFLIIYPTDCIPRSNDTLFAG